VQLNITEIDCTASNIVAGATVVASTSCENGWQLTGKLSTTASSLGTVSCTTTSKTIQSAVISCLNCKGNGDQGLKIYWRFKNAIFSDLNATDFVFDEQSTTSFVKLIVENDRLAATLELVSF
jgi:hypothetical protein